MRKGPTLLLLSCLTLLVACAPAGPAVVAVDSSGIQRQGKTIPWSEVQGVAVRGHLVDAERETVAPVLHLATEGGTFAVASCYPRRVPAQSYAGMYQLLSLARNDFDNLVEQVVAGAGLEPVPDREEEWVRPKEARPGEVKARTYHHHVGG